MEKCAFDHVTWFSLSKLKNQQKFKMPKGITDFLSNGTLQVQVPKPRSQGGKHLESAKKLYACTFEVMKNSCFHIIWFFF